MAVTLGKSVQGRRITAHVARPRAAHTIIVFGGFHGDEPKGVHVARRLIELLGSPRSPAISVRWVIVPVVNPDGFAERKRRNANRVDINRNFPTKNWTHLPRRSRMFGGDRPAGEPETRAIMAAVRRYKPSRIITIHSIGAHRFCNNYDGPARSLAMSMRRRNGYPVTSTIGYPTPGSFGTWAGVEREIPTITLELPSHHSPKRCWEDNADAILAAAQR